MFKAVISFGLPLLVTCSSIFPGYELEERASNNVVTVDLSTNHGSPQHLASGFIYGVPDKANLIPTNFYKNMGFNYGRAGGSQLPAPARGWVYSQTEFQNRFNSALPNYKTIRQQGGRLILLTSDIWGADGTQGIAMPGDNGNWTSYDAFLSSIFTNINSNKMQNGLDFEIWNEPDLGTVFWQRDQNQYLQMWGRGYHRVKAAYPNMPIMGPCVANAPSSDNQWLLNFYSFVKANGSIPDKYCWHEEMPGDDLQVHVASQIALESQFGLPSNPIVLNEYGLPDEQQPAGTAWFISRLERANVQGLRGNWLSGYSLHDYFAGLLGKPNGGDGESLQEAQSGGYWPNGEYQVYQYYNLNMTGHRAATTGSTDAGFDCYGTSGGTSTSVKVLCGARLTNGTYFVTFNNLASVGLPSSGSVNVHTYHFDYIGGTYGNVPAPQDQGYSTHYYSGGSLTFGVGAQQTTAYAFEFAAANAQ